MMKQKGSIHMEQETRAKAANGGTGRGDQVLVRID